MTLISQEKGKLSYWLPHQRKIQQVMTEHFAVESEYQTAANNEFNPRRLRIAVQSGEDNQDNAQELVNYLRSNGYRRAYLTPKSYSQPLSETKIIAQQGDNYSAARLRSELGVGEVIVESTGVLSSDITIQVGQDWYSSPFNPQYKPQNENVQTISYEK